LPLDNGVYAAPWRVVLLWQNRAQWGGKAHCWQLLATQMRQPTYLAKEYRHAGLIAIEQ